MAASSKESLIVLGCDVGKDSVVIFNHQTKETVSVENTKKALHKLLKTLKGQNVFVVCEATGGYEVLLLEECINLGLSIHRADARKVKAYIRSLGIYGKTDNIDARAIASYAMERKESLTLWIPQSKTRIQLQALVLYRLDLVKQKGAEQNRLQSPKSKPVEAMIRKHLQQLKALIAQAEKEIAMLMQQDKDIQKSAEIMQSIPGVGQITAAGLCALVPELGHMNRRQTASLLGLAPHPYESGKRVTKRYTKGGRQEARRLLFMSALVAMRYNPKLKIFYDRLVENGKKPIVALTALMRKIIIIINAKIRDELFYKES